MFEAKYTIAGQEILVRSHNEPHADEIEALRLAMCFGTEEFLKQYCPSKVLELGIGGGAFDEHPANGSRRKEKECCATLMAQALGVDKLPAVAHVLKYVARDDLHSASYPNELAAVAKLIYRPPDTHPEDAVTWMMIGLETKCNEPQQSKDFTIQTIARALETHFPEHPEVAAQWLALGLRAIQNAQEVFGAAVSLIDERETLLEELPVPSGPALKIVSVRSGNWQFARAARFKGADIVIQRQPSGHTQIFVNQRSGISLEDTAHMINLAEQIRAGGANVIDTEKLRTEGKIPGGRWYYHPKLGAILNGTFTTGDEVPPTALPLDGIREIVKLGVMKFLERNS
ncbi:MAG: hypothetical protein HY454_02170 [Parcubacteria group bacterium]|nr:hypothetical protein [Parcubacteria group bacterium]